MKKAIACLLALPLALAACGAQTTQPAPTTAPEMTTEATTENGKSTPAEVNQPGITGRMRPCSTEVETAAGLYSLHELFNEAANENVYCQNGHRDSHAGKGGKHHVGWRLLRYGRLG